MLDILSLQRKSSSRGGFLTCKLCLYSNFIQSASQCHTHRWQQALRHKSGNREQSGVYTSTWGQEELGTEPPEPQPPYKPIAYKWACNWWVLDVVFSGPGQLWLNITLVQLGVAKAGHSNHLFVPLAISFDFSNCLLTTFYVIVTANKLKISLTPILNHICVIFLLSYSTIFPHTSW